MSRHLLVQGCNSHLIPVHVYLCRAVIASLIKSIFSHSVYCNIMTLSVAKSYHAICYFHVFRLKPCKYLGFGESQQWCGSPDLRFLLRLLRWFSGMKHPRLSSHCYVGLKITVEGGSNETAPGYRLDHVVSVTPVTGSHQVTFHMPYSLPLA